MKLRALVVAMAVLITGTPAMADVACVQRELARIGLDPGPIDGQLGSKTLKAARIFQEGAVYLQDLEASTSFNWCQALKKEPPLASLQPQQVGVDTTSASSGSGTNSAMTVTPILGETPEYQVPAWVNNPR